MSDEGEDPGGEATESLGPRLPSDRIWPELEPGTRLAGRYEIVRRIGSGGYANVYLARDPVLQRDIALKVLHRERLGERGIARLRREATVAREVASPHLVEIYDLVVQEQTVFLVMEWIDGETLQDRIRRKGPLPVAEVLEIAEQVLAGLEALHEREIVHRDVKPSNILLDGDRAKLADLGLALHWPGDHTRITATEAVVGTAEYLAPEQILDRPVDARTDLYSLGATLYEALTGHPPFREGTSLAKILARLQDGPPPIGEDRPDVPRWLDQLVHRLLERRPEDRYPSVDSVRRALSTRTTQWLVPRQRRVAARFLILIVLVLGLGIVLWLRLAPPGPEFSHVVPLEEARGIQAVATDGSTLWRREGIPAEFVSFRTTPDGAVRLAGFFTDGKRTGTTDRRLRILDARTGELVRTVVLPRGSLYFPDFADTFSNDLATLDLDDDGLSEILVTYLHTYWPSYTVLYEPRIQRARLVFVAAGHHRPAGSVDLDGDGQRELLLHGYANRLGFNMGLAAVQLMPRVNRDLERRVGSPPHTPAAEFLDFRNPQLRWYALLPPDSCERAAPDCVIFRDAAIEISGEHGAPLLLDHHGFPLVEPSSLSPAERQRLRFRSYRELSEAQLLRATKSEAQALPLARRGTEDARHARDPLLVEWGGRVQGMILAELGRLEEARTTFREIWEESESPGNVAYDAAHVHHLQGALEHALTWYRRIFATHPSSHSGRHRQEALDGLILALWELDRPAEALDELDRLTAEAVQQESHAAILRATSLRRLGRDYEVPPSPRYPQDLDRYLLLELALDEEVDLARLLERVTEELDRSSVTVGLLRSLRGEILRRLGRTEEAVAETRSALETVRKGVDSNILYRTFLPRVIERLRHAREETERRNTPGPARSG